MEPVRVKLYGLFWMTKRRYLFQAVAGLVGALFVFLGWYFALRPLFDRLRQLPQTSAPSAYGTAILAILDNLPWILLAALAYKAAEVYVVLRLFARKAPPAAPTSTPKPPP